MATPNDPEQGSKILSLIVQSYQDFISFVNGGQVRDPWTTMTVMFLTGVIFILLASFIARGFGSSLSDFGYGIGEFFAIIAKKTILPILQVFFNGFVKPLGGFLTKKIFLFFVFVFMGVAILVGSLSYLITNDPFAFYYNIVDFISYAYAKSSQSGNNPFP